MKDLRGKNAIVTGASRGIGVHIAKTLAAQGVNLALAARNADALESTRRACEQAGVRAIAVACDVASQADLRRLVETAERDLGRVDILVNNAGIEITEAVQYLSIEQLDSVLEVNLHAPIRLIKLVLPGMLARKSGAIVNLSSLSGKSPTPYNAIYSASKHGLNGFTDSLGIELQGTGVTAGTVCPGFVADAGMWADAQTRGAKAPALLRAVSPQKVADAVVKVAKGAPEVVVSSGPIRPLLAFSEMAPRLRRTMINRMGVTKTFGKQADIDRKGDERIASSEPEREMAGRS